MAAMAACLMLMVTSVIQMGQMTYASVYMTINPEVRIDVNRKDAVVGLAGVNADGEDLIEGYTFREKDLNVVMDELVDRAIDMGYLHEGGTITLTLDADNDEWIIDHGDSLTTNLNQHLSEKLSVTIEVTDQKEQNNPVVIPIGPGASNYGESDYGESASTDQTVSIAPSDSPYGDSHYDDGQTDYGEADDSDDESEDGQTDYSTPNDSGDEPDDDDSDYAASEYGQSNYFADDTDRDDDAEDEQTFFETEDTDDGQSEYETQDDSSEDAQSDHDSGDEDEDD